MDILIDQLFTQLDKWRNFPAYQLERRADIFFAIYLKEIFKSKYQKSLDVIIPEFPVRVGSISKKLPDLNKSFKMDYLAVDQTNQEVFLIELKTDMHSRRDMQDWYLEKAMELNVPGLIDGIIQIYKASKQKTKYNHLLNELIDLGWLKMEGKTMTNSSRSWKISIIYIQPTNEKENENTISFDDIITLLHTKEDSFSKRFAKSLVVWKVNPNNRNIALDK